LKAAKGAKGRDKRKKKHLKLKDRRENDSGKEAHPLSPDENFPVSLSAGAKGETPLSSSNNDIIPSPVYHKDTSVITFGTGTSDVIQPASSSASEVILPATSRVSDVILRLSSGASDVIRQASSSSSDVILPASSSASDVILPASSNASDVILPAPSSASDVIRPASSSTSDVILPAPSGASDVILSASSSASDVILPAPSSASDVICPASSVASDIILPASSGASDVILPASSDGGDVNLEPTVDGVVSTVYSDKTVIQPDGIPSGRNILRAKRLSGRAAISQNSQESFAIPTAVCERAFIQIATGTGNITVTVPTSSKGVVIPSTSGTGSVILSSSDDEIVIPLTSSAVDAIPSTSVAEVVFPLTSVGINVIASIYRKGAITRSTYGDVSVSLFTSDARDVIAPSYGDGTVIPTSGSDATDANHSNASNDVVADILSKPSNGDRAVSPIGSTNSIATDAISKVSLTQTPKEETVYGDEHSSPAYLGAASEPVDLPFSEHAVIAALLEKDDFIKSSFTSPIPEIGKVTDCKDIGVVSRFSADQVIAKSMSHEEPTSAKKLRNTQTTAGEGFDSDRNRNFAHSMVSIQEDCLAAVCNNGGQFFCHGDTTPAIESTAERSGEKLPTNEDVRRGSCDFDDTVANVDMESDWFTDWEMPSPGSDSTYIVFNHGGR
jgi:hypothetical protein